jgi:uncharacterized protein
MSREAHLVRRWRILIPPMRCLPGCHDCCRDYAPSMTKTEWMEIKHHGKFSQGRTLESCPFLGQEGCGIYHQRPLICRVYGTVEQGEAESLGVFRAYCPRGARPEHPLPLVAAIKMQMDYEGILWTTACGLITQYIAYLKQEGYQEKLPLKFAYLRYLLSTKDGQRGLSLLMGIDRPRMEEIPIEQIHDLLRGGE